MDNAPSLPQAARLADDKMAFGTRTPARCLRSLHQRPPRPRHVTAISNCASRAYSDTSSSRTAADADAAEPEQGPMARRLEDATEEALLTGGRAGRRAVQDAGFSEELTQRLLDKVADARFSHDHAAALRAAGLAGGMPESGGTRAARDAAAAQPWTGAESQPDAVLRMLHDAHRPLRPGLRGRPKRTPPPLSGVPVDTRLKKQRVVGAGRKVADAREAASVYSGMAARERDEGLSESERAAMRKELRDRFSPAARSVPSSISGLAALANERIEDAIARGQFRHIPRGKGVERDARADNPFIDTTEYIMNKMIKKQEMVPPWIDRQQELVRAAAVFRSRLRNDWRRHAAMVMASRGGPLEEQVRAAQENARAEETLARPLRDADWEAAERSYMELAVRNLNSLTRDYNLMAPELAKKPYFSLERELRACFADVAPRLADEIRERARRPAAGSAGATSGSQGGGLLGRFVTEGRSVRVHESKAPHYGLGEFWRDLWRRSP